eukprot:jgi/Chrzof1/1828/Cz10g22200.t1
MAKDVKKQVAKEKTETQVAQDSQPEQTAQPAPQPKTTPLARASYNIAIHSLLMILIPFGLFFLSAYSFLDPVYKVTIGVPKQENKTLIGGVLAVLGVQVVIASFVISAFQEEAEPDKKEN